MAVRKLTTKEEKEKRVKRLESIPPEHKAARDLLKDLYDRIESLGDEGEQVIAVKEAFYELHEYQLKLSSTIGLLFTWAVQMTTAFNELMDALHNAGR